MAIVVLVNAAQPPPLGSKTNGQVALGTSSVALSIQSPATSGVSTLTWVVTSKPVGSACAVASASPGYPFATTAGPFDLVGRYLLTATDDAGHVASFALNVKTANGISIPALGETTEWDPSSWWEPDVATALAMIGGVDPILGGPYLLTTTDATPTAIATIAVPDNTAYLIRVALAYGETAGGTAAGVSGEVVVRRKAAGAAVLEASTLLGPFLLASVAGNNLVLTATGIAATTIKWSLRTTLESALSY